MEKLRSFLAEEDGPTAVEYAVMLALILVSCITIVTAREPRPAGRSAALTGHWRADGRPRGRRKPLTRSWHPCFQPITLRLNTRRPRNACQGAAEGAVRGLRQRDDQGCVVGTNAGWC